VDTGRTRLVKAILALVGFVFLASAGYFVIEDQYTWLESVYMAVITISTVGLGEVHGLSEAGRAWTIFVIAGGVMTGAVVLSMIVAMVVQGQIRGIFGRRQLREKIDNLSGHAIICGYGRMGRLVCEELRRGGWDVVVVESDSEQTAQAGEAGFVYVLGDAQQEATLATAGIERASVLLAALETDAMNVFLTLSARQANPNLTIIARAQEQTSEQKLKIAGASRVVCPQVLGASRMADIVLRPAVVDFVEIANRGVDLELDQLVLSKQSRLAGRTLAELELPRRTGAQIVAVRKADGQAIYHPTPDVKLSPGDTMILVGQRGAAAAVEELQAQAEPGST